MAAKLIISTWGENDDPSTKTQINHIDGDKSNNSIDNLEWVSPSDNQKHSSSVLGKKTPKPSRPPEPVLQFDMEGNYIAEYENAHKAAKFLSIPSGSFNIRTCCDGLGRKKTVGGFIWRYKSSFSEKSDMLTEMRKVSQDIRDTYIKYRI